MDCSASRIPYRQTESFTKITLDYIDQSPTLQPFFAHPVSLQGVKAAIDKRKQFHTNRQLLVDQLRRQYTAAKHFAPVADNIRALAQENTFTITTAHQNNIFTGPLFFIYKILHTISLATHLTKMIPAYRFVPVFYMGTEDADLEELNHIYLEGEKIAWNTSQRGAVGRMKVDNELIGLIESLQGQLAVLPWGNEIMSHVRDCYQPGTTIQEATFQLINTLFGSYGLVILLPDNAALKSTLVNVFEDELFRQPAAKIVEDTAIQFEAAGYKVQAHPREINLFYLKEDLRARITQEMDQDQQSLFRVQGTGITFSAAAMRDELKSFPENFSPNVILRGLYQSTILPDVAFIGGGGELAYWLQLKKLFEYYETPFPVLVLRNSFLVLEKKWQAKIGKMGLEPGAFFLPEEKIMSQLVMRESGKQVQLNGTLTEAENLYAQIRKQAAAIDPTLLDHVESLRTKTIHSLDELQKKMIRAEKRKFTDHQRQVHAIKSHLFPAHGLQERQENLLYYYALWGRSFIEQLYNNSLQLEQEFVILSEK